MIGRSDPAAPPSRRLALTHWALLLAGPVVGTVYFFVVYLFAEASCADGVDLLSPAALRVLVFAAGAASAVVLLACIWRAQRLWRVDSEQRNGDAGAADHRDNRRFMLFVAFLLLGMFVLFVAFVAAPAAEGSLC